MPRALAAEVDHAPKREPFLRAEVVIPALLLFALFYEYRHVFLDDLDLEEWEED